MDLDLAGNPRNDPDCGDHLGVSQQRLIPLAWLLSGLGFAALFLSIGLYYRYESSIAIARQAASQNLREVAAWVDELAEQVLEDRAQAQDADAADALAAAVGRLLAKVVSARLPVTFDPRSLQDSRVIPLMRPGSSGTVPALARSGLFDAPIKAETSIDPMASQEFTANSADMIARLDPRSFRWIDSSLAEQQFLGWRLDDLRKMSFLDVVHPDHRELAREQLAPRASRGKGMAWSIGSRPLAETPRPSS